MKIQITIRLPEWLDRILAWPILQIRRRRYGYAYRRIRLTQGKFAKVDPEDYHKLDKYTWFAVRSRATYYAVRIDETAHKYALISMHKQIMPVAKGLIVDHEKGDGLDNRKDKLRGITRAQNNLNRGKHAKASSKYKGVCWSKSNERWMASISVNKRRIYIGYV